MNFTPSDFLIITSATATGLGFAALLSRPTIYRAIFFSRVWVACVLGGVLIWLHFLWWTLTRATVDMSGPFVLFWIYVAFGGPFIAWQIGKRQGEDALVAQRKKEVPTNNGTAYKGGAGGR